MPNTRLRVGGLAATPGCAAREGVLGEVSQTEGLVQRLWNYCNILRDDGLSYGDYVEQLTYLLFLKMADEQTHPPFSRPPVVPEGLDWQSLLDRDGPELETQYIKILSEL